ncbi:MAG: hypothetical protein KGI67_09680 [Pseudomonadota bacterium]|nr:hypothetical protein [Pseudomonadota bacterium]
MKRTDLEKLKAKQLGNRLARERDAQSAGSRDARGERTPSAASDLVGKLLRKALEGK